MTYSQILGIGKALLLSATITSGVALLARFFLM
jgi:hypothetical protein